MSEIQNPPWARIVFDNLIADLGPSLDGDADESFDRRAAAFLVICGRDAASIASTFGWNLPQKRGEPVRPPTTRRLLEGAICIRWNCAPDTLRAWFVGRRRPSRKKNPQFFSDLKTYGRARFKNGAAVKSTLGKGPDYAEFDDTTPAGSDRSRAAA